MLADLEEHTAASLPGAGLTLVRTVSSGVALLAAPLASQGSSASSAGWANRARAQQVSRFTYLQESARLLHSRGKSPLSD